MLSVNGLISTILDYQHYDGLWDDHVQTDYLDMRYLSYDDYKTHMVSDVLAMRSRVLGRSDIQRRQCRGQFDYIR